MFFFIPPLIRTSLPDIPSLKLEIQLRTSTWESFGFLQDHPKFSLLHQSKAGKINHISKSQTRHAILLQSKHADLFSSILIPMEGPYQIKAASAWYGPVSCQHIVWGSQQGQWVLQPLETKFQKNGPLNTEVLV